MSSKVSRFRGVSVNVTGNANRTSPPRLPRPASPQHRGRTVEPFPPALDEFLKALGEMAADAVLRNYRKTGELAPVSIKSPGGNYRTGGGLGEGIQRGRFIQAKGRVREQGIGGSDGREE